MDDNERKLMEILEDGLSEVMDACVKQIGRQIADGIIEEVEETTKDVPETCVRKPLIYMAIIDRLQAHINDESNDIKVT